MNAARRPDTASRSSGGKPHPPEAERSPSTPWSSATQPTCAPAPALRAVDCD